MAQRVSFEPIGVVRAPVRELVDEGWGAVASRIALRPELAGGFDGLDTFSHALVITHLSQARFEPERHLRRRPRGLERLPLVGIFAQRAKDRPNPIGVTAVEIVSVAPLALEVRGLDAVDGTPVLDVKPYVPAFDRVEAARVPSWMDEILKEYF